MSKSVLIISTSPRKGGNSDTLAEEFARGARETGNQVEKIVLYDKAIGFCKVVWPARKVSAASFTMMRIPSPRKCSQPM